MEDATAAAAAAAAACAGVSASGREQDAAAEEEELAWGPHLQLAEAARLRWEGLAYGVRGKGAILQQGQHG